LLGLRSRRNARSRLALGALLAFGLRALIPFGFMPAGDGTFSLMICPAGFPPALLPHAQTMPGAMGMPMPHSPSGHGESEYAHCIFTTGFSAAPPPLLLATLLLLIGAVTAIAVVVSAPAGVRRVHIPQARAPPARC